ncbi:hypothetical protein BABINDRAFT_160822 [Babjeviella inositovora NRRL Y-12698]|uniref:Phosphatidylserine decarboxylase proenzyme 2 n=1 Tax=Babjeviella inositovora NRRL Y-12698 TaxID=984486 RepID=A0A1E3QUG2_9ASCO|nr:uncharacterized protein BABINDRAFT_160822 [Babjeviella inositovora NRRL Y-12698]ODQ80557.1 hypothetical protein BABINDRAFT_160822 [Babjeviella inositovora NRRL Y-12698]
MKFLGRSKATPPTLWLEIEALQAKNLTESAKNCHPKLIASINGTSQSTCRANNTVSPQWGDTLSLPLDDFGSQVVKLMVWDAHRITSNYLGELRLNVSELFEDRETVSPARWYKLHASKYQHSFVPGHVELAFGLAISKKRTQSLDVSDIRISVPETTLEVSKLKVSDALVLELLEKWRRNTTGVTALPDSQGFYSEDEGEVDILDPKPSSDGSPTFEYRPVSALLLLPFDDGTDMSSYVSSDATSTAELSDCPLSRNHGSTLAVASGKTKRLAKFQRAKARNYELFKTRNVLGVVFVEILLCTDLPPLKSTSASLRFDMDPFVVVSFGKKTFRTSWRNHTLNPIFNERLAFEIMLSERDYDVTFSVLDKDRFSFHDDVGVITVPLNDLVEIPSDLSENSRPTSDKVSVIDDSTHVSFRKSTVLKKKTITHQSVDTAHFKTLALKLELKQAKYAEKYRPELKVRTRFLHYDELRRQFWMKLLAQYDMNKDGHFDFMELTVFLESIGSTLSDETIESFYAKHGKSLPNGDTLGFEEIVDSLEELVYAGLKSENHIINIDKCPVCGKARMAQSADMDIVTHVAICASKDWSIVDKLLFSRYASVNQATRKWYSKALIKLTYGKYVLGGKNSGNILVQDRATGIILEEKMSMYVRLGIRLLYNKFDKADTKRVRRSLKSLSIKQGAKFDSLNSAKDISSFIKFHKLDLTDCLNQDPEAYATFNEFFYRALKPGARPVTSPEEPRIVVSPADCRSCTFDSISAATEIWIKGRNFSVEKLMAGHFPELLLKLQNCAIGIFRLAPQDYHRFHSPVEGVIGEIKEISGDYYTVNPMAIRSELDVFGENVRCLVPIHTKDFSTVLYIAIGAMMVGSSVFTVSEGQTVKKGDEIGYFKFGGSTILTLFEPKYFQFDLDLVQNSSQSIETLVRVGQSIGHSPSVPESTLSKRDIKKMTHDERLTLFRTITGGDYAHVNTLSWESQQVDEDALDMDEDALDMDEDALDMDEDALDVDDDSESG